jgi:hypothetical protein
LIAVSANNNEEQHPDPVPSTEAPSSQSLHKNKATAVAPALDTSKQPPSVVGAAASRSNSNSHSQQRKTNVNTNANASSTSIHEHSSDGFCLTIVDSGIGVDQVGILPPSTSSHNLSHEAQVAASANANNNNALDVNGIPKLMKHSSSVIGLDAMIEERKEAGGLTTNVVRIEVPFGKPIEEVYAGVHDGKILGSGISGLVRLVTHKATGVLYAVKCLDLGLIETEEGLHQLREEIFIMCQLDHPNIVRLEEVYESHK